MPQSPQRPRLALDTNVVVYGFDSTAGEKHAIARAILRSGDDVQLRLPLQVAGETFAVLTRRIAWPTADARSTVTRLAELIPIIVPSTQSLLRAMRLSEEHSMSFWDAAVVVAAADGDCTVLLTEDLQDGRQFSAAETGRPIRVLNPFAANNCAILEGLGVNLLS